MGVWCYLTCLYINSKCCILQVKAGTIFDNFLITDDEKFAEEVGNETFGKTKVSYFSKIASDKEVPVSCETLCSRICTRFV